MSEIDKQILGMVSLFLGWTIYICGAVYVAEKLRNDWVVLASVLIPLFLAIGVVLCGV